MVMLLDLPFVITNIAPIKNENLHIVGHFCLMSEYLCTLSRINTSLHGCFAMCSVVSVHYASDRDVTLWPCAMCSVVSVHQIKMALCDPVTRAVQYLCILHQIKMSLCDPVPHAVQYLCIVHQITMSLCGPVHCASDQNITLWFCTIQSVVSVPRNKNPIHAFCHVQCSICALCIRSKCPDPVPYAESYLCTLLYLVFFKLILPFCSSRLTC